MSAAIEAGFNVAAAVLAVGVARWTRDVAYPRLAASVAATAATPGTLGTAATAAAGYLRTVGYDVVTDGVLTKCWLSAVIAFLVMGVGVCTLLDGAPRLFHRFKTQGSRSYFTPREWLQATAVSMFNLCLLGWLVIIPNWRLRAALHQPPLSEADPWRWNTELPKLAFCVLFVDVWFFLTHKLIHWGPLYTVIHKFHHRFTAPTAVACMYSTPPEYLLGNLAAVALGPTLMNCHPTSTYTWLAFALISTCGEHSGYTFFHAERHDAHHEHYKYNFGPVGFADSVFGTQFVGSSAWKRRQGKAA